MNIFGHKNAKRAALFELTGAQVDMVAGGTVHLGGGPSPAGISAIGNATGYHGFWGPGGNGGQPIFLGGNGPFSGLVVGTVGVMPVSTPVVVR